MNCKHVCYIAYDINNINTSNYCMLLLMSHFATNLRNVRSLLFSLPQFLFLFLLLPLISQCKQVSNIQVLYIFLRYKYKGVTILWIHEVGFIGTCNKKKNKREYISKTAKTKALVVLLAIFFLSFFLLIPLFSFLSFTFFSLSFYFMHA